MVRLVSAGCAKVFNCNEGPASISKKGFNAFAPTAEFIDEFPRKNFYHSINYSCPHALLQRYRLKALFRTFLSTLGNVLPCSDDSN